MTSDVIFIMGPQGSGKGTQGRILAQRLSFFFWDMGAILREEKDLKIRGEQTVAEVIANGTLLSDEEVLLVFRDKIKKIPSDRGIVFDGIPRRIGQAEEVVDYFRERVRNNMTTLFLDIPHEETFKRLLLRAKVEGRADDTPEGIEFRLKQYEEATVPMFEYMRANTDFIEIDGRPPIPEVTRAIFQALGLENGN